MVKFNLDLFRPGDGIVAKNEGGFFGNRIEKKQWKKGFTFEQAKFTHVEVMIAREVETPDKFWSVRVAPPKAKLVNFPEFYKGKYIKVVRYKDYDSFTRLKDVAIWAATHVNVPYDIPGILSFLSFLRGWIKQHTSWWFCVESYIFAHQKIYPGAFGNLKPEKSMPAHALLPEYTYVIWEGVIPG